jgi:probable 2-oxoglutarate dehydrogenase E1 component DHKTD1
LRAAYKKHLDSELENSASFVPVNKSLGGKWKGMVIPNSPEAVRDPETGVTVDILKHVGRMSVHVPEGFVRQIQACSGIAGIRLTPH